MSFWDDLGNGLAGAAGGFATGGFPGMFAGGIRGGLSGGPMTFESALQNAIGGGLMGRAGFGMPRPIGGSMGNGGVGFAPSGAYDLGWGTPQAANGQMGLQNSWYNPGTNTLGGTSYSTDYLNPPSPYDFSGGYGGGRSGFPNLGNLSGIFSGNPWLGGGSPSMGNVNWLSKLFGGGGGPDPYQSPQQPQSQSWLSKIGGAIGGLGGAIGGLPAQLSGLVSGNKDALSGLGLLGGAGLLGYGLSQGTPKLDLESVFRGSQQQTNDQIQQQIDRENAIRGGAEQQYLGSRAQGQNTLEDILGQGSQDAFARAIQGRQEQLNRQGLLRGPSGAMDFALAQEASKLRQANLPYLMNYANQTQTGLEGMRQRGLEGALGLQEGGLQRNFGLGDLQRSASLKQQLLQAQMEDQRRKGLIGAGATLAGAGLGGAEGARTGAMVGGAFGGGSGGLDSAWGGGGYGGQHPYGMLNDLYR